MIFGMVAFPLISAGLGSTRKKVESNASSYNPEIEGDSLSLKNGQFLFTSHCFNCHTTYISHAYTESRWSSILERMSLNAGIDSTGQVDLTNYIFDQLRQTDTSYVIRTIGAYQQW